MTRFVDTGATATGLGDYSRGAATFSETMVQPTLGRFPQE